MVSKICSKCSENKSLKDFNKRTNSKDGLRFECKSCQKINYQTNRMYYISKMKENRLNKLDEYIQRDKNYYETNKTTILSKKQQYHQDNKEKLLTKAKKYYSENKDARSVYNKQWVKENITQNREYHNEYSKAYRAKYPHISLWRSILSCSLKRLGKFKEDSTIDSLGYSAVELKNHLENLFTEGMSWDNHGEWHVDHIKPISKFLSSTPVNVVNALSNLQPLWRLDNIIKSDNFTIS